MTGLGGKGTEARQRIEVWNRVAAKFTQDKISGAAPLTVNFTNQTEGDFESLQWRRDAVAVSTAENPAFIFPAGVYQVDLVARGKGGDTSTSSPVTIIQ